MAFIRSLCWSFLQSLDAQAPNGSFCTVTLDVTTSALPVGVYYGANGLLYGGTREAIDTTVTIIQSSLMTMTRVATVDAPTQYITNANAQLGGNHSHDPVPGAVITYTITYSNVGSGSAESVSIVDKVPGSTEAAHVNAGTGSQAALTNVTLTPALPTAAGWTSYYSTSATPGMGVNDLTGWVTVNATGVASSFATGSGIKYVRWRKTEVQVGESNRTLTWGVMIK